MKLETVLKRFDTPDEVRTFPNGRFELVRLGGITIGRATYQPGWKWSEHVGTAMGSTSCNVEHVGMVVSGTAAAAWFADSFESVAGAPHDAKEVARLARSARPRGEVFRIYVPFAA